MLFFHNALFQFKKTIAARALNTKAKGLANPTAPPVGEADAVLPAPVATVVVAVTGGVPDATTPPPPPVLPLVAPSVALLNVVFRAIETPVPLALATTGRVVVKTVNVEFDVAEAVEDDDVSVTVVTTAAAPPVRENWPE